MVKVREDLTGKRFGYLTVLEQVEDYTTLSGRHRDKWLCKCDCGNIIEVRGMNLKNGHTKSCGCYRTERIRQVKKKYNTYDLSGEYGVGYTSNGKEFYFDLKDYDKIKDYCWYIDNGNYVNTWIKNKGRTRMHRLIMNFPKDKVVDHINHNKYDNRKSNLRICTQQQNSANKRLLDRNASGIVGISWNSKSNKWEAYIRINYKKIHLGLYQNIEDAIQVRKEAEEKYFGKYAYKGD